MMLLRAISLTLATRHVTVAMDSVRNQCGQECLSDSANGAVSLLQSLQTKTRSTPSDGSNSGGSLAQSFGFFNESCTRWQHRRALHRAQKLKELRESPGHDIGPGKLFWQYNYEPTFHCTFGERLGSTGDGGKWVCDPYLIQEGVEAGKPCLVYSVGSAGHFDFEEAVQRKISQQCEIHVFDPEPADTWPTPEGMSYHQIALGTGHDVVHTVMGTTAATKTMADVVQLLGHSGKTIDIFKIDCEGCEWASFKDWFGSGVDIRQVLVEQHFPSPGNTSVVHEFNRFMSDNGYVITSKEPNTMGCKGDCVEYAFLKLDPQFGKLDPPGATQCD